VTPEDAAVLAALADRAHPIEARELLQLLDGDGPIANRLDQLVRGGAVRRSVVRRTPVTEPGRAWDANSEGVWADVHGYALTPAGLEALNLYEGRDS